ncbi:MAG: polyphosphate--AMP phosphotransferase [Coriobacteriia bacterium]|nr:polyphosphate--AMP phosphotransferase [Coriobacteriia bacterium]
MLEKVKLSDKKLAKEEYKALYSSLIKKLVLLQQQARAEEVGLVVLFEGWNGAGKGSRISDIVYHLDARATTVHVTKDIDEDELNYFHELNQDIKGFFPAMQEFWRALGPRGNITFFDRGWYTSVIQRMLFSLFGSDLGMEKEISPENKRQIKGLAENPMQSMAEFENQLIADGYAVLKFFVHISEKEQIDRLAKLYINPATQWRVSKEKLVRSRNYKRAYWVYDELLELSDTAAAPWILINGEDRRQANLTICAEMVNALEGALAAALARKQADLLQNPAPAELAPSVSRFAQTAITPCLEQVDYRLVLEEKEYRARLKAEQEKLHDLELKMFLKRIPLILMFEGWDAAGKGGIIKRVAQALDARAYTIFPSPAPTPLELLHPHLWRYWTRLPKAGHVGIYDRSWYGRVLVERVEGFATPAEVCRAYDEINGFELDLVNWGALLLKFWVEISPEEQLKRFYQREEDPVKLWKITEDDWRNRDKYPEYRVAVNDMFRLTSTSFAPWVILESEDKLYARVKTLQLINATLEAHLQES